MTPLFSAASSSAVKTPLPPTRGRGVSNIRSPYVLMTCTSRDNWGQEVCNNSHTYAVCQRASTEPRVPNLAIDSVMVVFLPIRNGDRCLVCCRIWYVQGEEVLNRLGVDVTCTIGSVGLQTFSWFVQ